MNDEVFSIARPEVKSMKLYLHEDELNLKIYTDESAFSSLEIAWTELAQRSNQMICMSYGWASSWWNHFGRHKDRSLFIVAVYDNHKLVAIFPFYKSKSKIGNVILQNRLQLIGSGGNLNEQLGFSDDYGVCDFLDVIVDSNYNSSVAGLIIEFLHSRELSKFRITFHHVRDDSYVRKTLFPLLKKSKRRVIAELTDACYYVELDQDGDFQDFILKSKTNARRRFRQTLRARGSGNEYIIEEPASIHEVDQMIDKLIQMHQDRWNKIGYPGAFQDERFIDFFKEISFAAYRDDRLWIKQAVDLNGVCAVRMLLKYNGRFYDYISGYDAESPSAKFRPGIGLLLDLVVDSFDQHIERIELLRGDEEYKHDFTQLAMPNWKITIPEIRDRKSGWGIYASGLRICSIIHKYLNREKMLLKVQFNNVGFKNMITAYFKFRFETIRSKIKDKKKSG